MTKKGQNKNKFIRIITMPLKVLCKAYMRSITGCAARTHYSSSSVDVVSVNFPRSRSTSSAFSSSSSTTGRRSCDDDYIELIRASSVRSIGHKNEINMFLHQHRQENPVRAVGAVAAKKSGLPKSSSVGMKMAKIDEEEEERSVKKGTDLLYPRSRSYAVTFKGSKF
ncbi:unnamed protein product [Cochlearia groenlandica]